MITATARQRLENCLERILEQAEEREDVLDGDGYMRPNPYMIIATEARQALALLPFLESLV